MQLLGPLHQAVQDRVSNACVHPLAFSDQNAFLLPSNRDNVELHMPTPRPPYILGFERQLLIVSQLCDPSPSQLFVRGAADVTVKIRAYDFRQAREPALLDQVGVRIYKLEIKTKKRIPDFVPAHPCLRPLPDRFRKNATSEPQVYQSPEIFTHMVDGDPRGAGQVRWCPAIGAQSLQNGQIRSWLGYFILD